MLGAVSGTLGTRRKVSKTDLLNGPDTLTQIPDYSKEVGNLGTRFGQV
jgi:hypothetical protein